MMQISVIDKHIPSADGVHTLRGKVFIPTGEIRGIFQISHGMAEHIERYFDFMQYLAENGFVCAAHDHIGHGKTADSEDELGYFAKKDGDVIVYRDVIAFGESLKADFPEKPLILMGHSMGSFIARNAAIHAPSLYRALIIMGTGGPNPLSGIGLALTRTVAKAKGEKHRSKLVQALTFGGYNKRTDKKHPYAWLTYDEARLKKYASDTHCGFRFTVSAMHDLIKMQNTVNRQEWFESMPKTMPILLVSGEEDPVGNYGRGVRTVYEKLKGAGAKNTELKLYPKMRHEVLNELERKTVYADILAFLQKNI